MTRTSIFILGLSAALIFPTAASAHCGSMQGSFIKTCEQGVQVYRHNSLSGMPAPMSQGETAIEVEKIRAKTAQRQITAQSRAADRNADLREREISILDFEARTNNQALRRSPFAFSNPGYAYGSNFRSIRVNSRRHGSKSRFNAKY